MEYRPLGKFLFVVRIFKALKILKCSPRQALNPTKNNSPRFNIKTSIIMNTKYQILNTVRSRGVTALELLMVIAILGVLLAVITPSFLNFRRNSILNTETLQMVTIINKARLSSISSKGDMQYGIHFEATKVVLFQGTTYSSTANTNEVYVLDPALSLSPIVINGGGVDIVFQKITGSTNQNATTTLRVIGSTTASSTIVVRPTGVASTQ